MKTVFVILSVLTATFSHAQSPNADSILLAELPVGTKIHLTLGNLIFHEGKKSLTLKNSAETMAHDGDGGWEVKIRQSCSLWRAGVINWGKQTKLPLKIVNSRAEFMVSGVKRGYLETNLRLVEVDPKTDVRTPYVLSCADVGIETYGDYALKPKDHFVKMDIGTLKFLFQDFGMYIDNIRP